MLRGINRDCLYLFISAAAAFFGKERVLKFDIELPGADYVQKFRDIVGGIKMPDFIFFDEY